jgi:hypothetical protein
MSSGIMNFLHSLTTTARDVIPIALILFGFQIFVLRRKMANLGAVITGFIMVLLGLTLFLQGLEQALFPLGKLMAQQLTAPEFLGLNSGDGQHHYFWLYLFAAALGFSTTIAEPALIAVAIKANEVSSGAIGTWGLRIAVAIGVSFGITLGTYRIISGTPVHYYIIAGYILVVIQTFFCPKSIVALAYDSGGVTTSTVTVPLVTALGLGLSSSIPGRNPLLDGFGLIAFASLFPIMSVMGYAQLSDWQAKRALKTKLKRYGR